MEAGNLARLQEQGSQSKTDYWLRKRDRFFIPASNRARDTYSHPTIFALIEFAYRKIRRYNGLTVSICNMAVITDLTWQQLEAASGTNLIIIDNANGLTIRLSALTTALVNNKSQAGVVQALYKLREIAYLAQITANQNANIGERLAAFPPASTGTAINGYVISNGQIVTKTPLQTTGIVGATN